MSCTPPLRLPDAMWSIVFQLLEASWVEPRRHPIPPPMLVCKKWKELATPFLYRRFYLSVSDNRLNCFAKRLLSCPKYQQQVSTNARYVYIGVDKEPPFEVSFVLDRMRSLVTVDLHGGAYELHILGISCSATLRSLKFTVTANSCIAAAVHELGALENLHRLSFNAMHSRFDGAAYEDSPAELYLGCLHDLSVYVPNNLGHLDRLWHGSFPSLTHLHMPAAFRYGKSHQPLYTFLQKHKAYISQLDVHICPTANELLPGFECLKRLNIYSVLPHESSVAEWVDCFIHLPASVYYVSPVLLGHHSDHTVLTELLDGLVATGKRLRFKRLLLNLSWSQLILDSSPKLNHYLAFARRMEQELGVVVVDQKGMQLRLDRPNDG